MTDMLKRQAHTDMTERRESLDGIGEQSEERIELLDSYSSSALVS